MGSVRFFNLPEIKGDCKVFVETGAGEGYSTSYLTTVFDKGYCVELIPDIANKLRDKNLPGLTVLEGNSFNVLEQLLPTIKEPCLFWLDAHYPECFGMNVDDKDKILPLVKELKLILKREYKDIILIDDLRIYRDGPFTHGNRPAELLAGEGLFEILNDNSLDVTYYFEEEGYIKITKI